ncbi:MAG: DUF4421 family protein [Flavobacteriales bacterium]|nr:DUF4421 family protein [Flavobacteriales bacterium]
MLRKILLFTSLVFLVQISFSQEIGKTISDSSYIRPLSDYLNVRLYLSRKYTNLIISRMGRNQLKYEPNSTVNFGIGLTIKSFSLNLAYGFKGLNQDEGKGTTKFLDLQSHIYKQMLVIDIIAQLYDGFFLENTSKLSSNFPDNYYLRPDIDVQLYGISGYYVLNGAKFSYAAPFVQNEIQEKSAGSFLLGARAITSFSKSDSSYIPFFVDDSLYGNFGRVNRMSAYQFGPSGGYAYSLILKKRFFLTASLNLAFMIGPVTYWREDGKKERDWQLNPVLGLRAGVGYNSPKWYLGITFLQEGTSIKGIDNLAEANISGGNVRLNYVKRFKMGKGLKAKLDKIHL